MTHIYHAGDDLGAGESHIIAVDVFCWTQHSVPLEKLVVSPPETNEGELVQ